MWPLRAGRAAELGLRVQAEGEASVVQSEALAALRTAVGAAAEWEGQLRRALAKKGASTDVGTLLGKVRAAPTVKSRVCTLGGGHRASWYFERLPSTCCSLGN